MVEAVQRIKAVPSGRVSGPNQSPANRTLLSLCSGGIDDFSLIDSSYVLVCR